MDNDEHSVLDRTTICANWYRLWSSFGFNDHQWSSRAAKVEEYTRVKILNSHFSLLFVFFQKLLDDKLLTYKEQLSKRQQLLKQSLDDYEDLLERTGLSSSIEVNLKFHCVLFYSFPEIRLRYSID